jgi:hypothetical protein
MLLKDIKKSSALVARVEELDKEIIGLEKHLSNVIDSKPNSLNVKLSIKFPEKEEEKREDVLDDDGSIKPKYLGTEGSDSYSWMYHMHRSNAYIVNSPKEEDNTIISDKSISEYTTIQILGLMVEEKKAIRQGVIFKLKKLGINI